MQWMEGTQIGQIGALAVRLAMTDRAVGHRSAQGVAQTLVTRVMALTARDWVHHQRHRNVGQHYVVRVHVYLGFVIMIIQLCMKIYRCQWF